MGPETFAVSTAALFAPAPAPIMSYSQTVNANRSTKAHTLTRVANPSAAQRAKEKASERERAQWKGIFMSCLTWDFIFLTFLLRDTSKRIYNKISRASEAYSHQRATSRLARLRQELCLLQPGTMFHPAGSGVLQGLSERAANTTTQNMHLKHTHPRERERPAVAHIRYN